MQYMAAKLIKRSSLLAKLKNRKFVGHFVTNPQSTFFQSETFAGILRYVQHHSGSCKMRQDQADHEMRAMGAVRATLLSCLSPATRA